MRLGGKARAQGWLQGVAVVVSALAFAQSAAADTFDVVDFLPGDADVNLASGAFGSALAADADGNYYTASSRDAGCAYKGPCHPATADISKYSPQGTLLWKYDSLGDGPGQIRHPFGLTIGADDNLYVLVDSRILIFDPGGHYLSEWTLPPDELIESIAADSSGHLFASSSGADPSHITKFSLGGDVLASWESPPPHRQYEQYTALATGPDGSVYAGDAYKGADGEIQRFDTDGNLLGTWPAVDTSDPNDAGPYSIATDAEGHVYGGYGLLTREYDVDGKELYSWPNQGANRAMAAYTDSGGDTFLYATGGSGVLRFAEVPVATELEWPGYVTSAHPSIRFSARGGPASFECRLDQTQYKPCTSPYRPPQPLSDGYHDFEVRARTGGFVDPTPEETSFAVDTTVLADFVAAKRQPQRGGEVTVAVQATLRRGDPAGWWDLGGTMEAGGTVIVGGRHKSEYPLRTQRNGLVSAEDPVTMMLRPAGGIPVQSAIRAALLGGRKIRARIWASMTDSQGNKVSFNKLVRLRPAK